MAEREMTLQEWVERLPEIHRARREYDALAARLAEAERDAKRLDWLESRLFDGKWDGTIGRPKSWHMAGPYRHTLLTMRGDVFRDAIDAAMQAETVANSGDESL